MNGGCHPTYITLTGSTATDVEKCKCIYCLSTLIEELDKRWNIAEIIYLERINNLEVKVKELEGSDHDERIYDLENILAESRLIKIEQRVKDIEYRLNNIVEFPTEVDIRLDDIERRLDKSMDNLSSLSRNEPFSCPVCNSSGVFAFSKCRVCEGKGIIWG